MTPKKISAKETRRWKQTRDLFLFSHFNKQDGPAWYFGVVRHLASFHDTNPCLAQKFNEADKNGRRHLRGKEASGLN